MFTCTTHSQKCRNVSCTSLGIYGCTLNEHTGILPGLAPPSVVVRVFRPATVCKGGGTHCCLHMFKDCLKLHKTSQSNSIKSLDNGSIYFELERYMHKPLHERAKPLGCPYTGHFR